MSLKISALQSFDKHIFLCSANKIATVTNTTLEIVISQHAFGSVYGEDGGNLDRIIQVITYAETRGTIDVNCVVFRFRPTLFSEWLC